MDDDRLLSSLRRIAEPVEPSAAFLDRLYDDLADELGYRGAPTTPVVRWRAPYASRRSLQNRRLAWLVAAALLVLGIVAGMAVVGALLDRRPEQIPSGLGDVTMYRGDAERSGTQPGPGPTGEPVLIWSVKTDGPIQFNPILVSGVLYVGSDDGHLYALDAMSGARRWAFDAGAPVKGSALSDSGLVAVTDAASVLHVVEASTGRERWRAPGIVEVGSVAGGILYAPGDDNRVRGLDLRSGADRWSWQAPGRVLYVAVVDDVAYVTVEGSVYAVGLPDGVERWHHETAGSEASVATLADDQVYVSTRQGRGEVTALDRTTGARIWQFSDPSGIVISVGAIANGVVYAPSDGAGFFALAASDGSVLWHTPGVNPLRATPIVDGMIFAAIEEPGGLVALRASSGDALWEVGLGAPMQGWPVVSGGLAFTTNGLGEIQAYGDRAIALASPSGSPVEPSTPPNPFSVRGILTPAKTGLDRAADLDIGPDGNLYVVDFRPRVSVISPSGELIRDWGRAGDGDGEFDFAVPNLENAASIAVGSDGLVYVSDGNNGRVQVFTPTGHFLRQIGTRGSGKGQLLIAWNVGVDATGNVYVIDTGLGELSKFDPEGGFVWRVRGVGAADPELKSGSHGLKFDQDGHLWIANDDGSRLIAFDANGKQVDQFGEPGSGPGQLAAPCGLNLDDADNLYVYNCIGGRVQVFDPDHQLIGLSDEPADERSQSFAFGPDGRMYRLGPDDTIEVIEVALP